MEGIDIALERLRHGQQRPLLEVFDGLSERSRSLRFHGSKPRLHAHELEQLADVGCCGREAVAAVERESRRAIGIARFVRDEDDPRSAEVAFEVVDDWQGRGIGRLLMQELVPLAHAAGIERFRARVLPGNDAAVAILRRAGRIVSAVFDEDAYELVVETRQHDLSRAA
jgi:RimJ/RimL family protein N-acetyltransferase